MPWSLRDTPISRKLLLVIFLTILLAMLLMRGTFFVYEFLAYRQVTLRQFSTLGKIVADNSTAALAFQNRDDATEILAALKAEPLVVGASLYDQEGKLFATYPATVPPATFPSVLGADGWHFTGSDLTGFQPVVQRDKRLGTLYFRIETAAILGRWIRVSLLVAAVVIAVILLVTYGFSQLLQRQISLPILALAETARAISDRRDYSVRAVKHSGDEVGLLTDAFNQMLAEIHAQKTALDEHAIVAITNPQGRITYVNDKFCAISKYSREELLGQDHRIINSGHHSKEFIRGLWTTIAQGRVWKGEIRNRAKDGSHYWVATTIVPFLRPDGKPYQYVAIRADITAHKQAQEEIQALNRDLEQRVISRTAQLEAANEELEAFSYSVSHDLRAPLRHIDGFANMLNTQAAGLLDETGRRHLRTISEAAKKMGLLIDDLLTFSRMNRVQMNRHTVNLNTLTEEVIRMLEGETKGRAIDWQISPLPEVEGDAAMLRQVLGNLVGNAVKYTRKREKARIEIGPEDAGIPGLATIFVRDNGAGFDMKYEQKLFGVFQRLHSATEFEGTGVGLALVRRIIQRHGGRIWAEGKVDQGATFHFSLPVAAKQKETIL